ncbi:unnamed protein product [Meganyctiphanes norvegica]|uniref:Uncharacterized protein n=1 Tax=Meganyctiphanes norvegica TaxID=48144 RepID=A0AAV2PP14_MEGNR
MLRRNRGRGHTWLLLCIPHKRSGIREEAKGSKDYYTRIPQSVIIKVACCSIYYYGSWEEVFYIKFDLKGLQGLHKNTQHNSMAGKSNRAITLAIISLYTSVTKHSLPELYYEADIQNSLICQ